MRFNYLILFLILLSSRAFSQMCNTTSSNMGSIIPTTTWQNVTGTSGAKRFWTFNATAGCIYNFSTCNSLFTNDTYLRLYSGTNPTSAILQTSNDDNGPYCTGNKASLNWTCPTTGAYSILLTNYSCANLSASTILSYRLNCPAPLLNDNCSGAINITTLPYTSPVTSNNTSTSDVPTSISACSTFGYNLWYRVVGNGNLLTASTCNASTNFDTEIRVYTGSCASLNSMAEVVCNDDAATCSSGSLKSTASWCSNVGVTYFITVGYYSSSAGFGNYVLSVTNGDPCVPLPITLIDFSGEFKDDKVFLKWSTASEQNNDYFYIERSLDGLNWIRIIEKTGSGNTSYQIDYSSVDNKPFIGINYYRLTQVDFDGQKETFDIIAVNVKKDLENCEGSYYDLTGREVDMSTCPSGIYIKKCEGGSKIVRKL